MFDKFNADRVTEVHKTRIAREIAFAENCARLGFIRATVACKENIRWDCCGTVLMFNQNSLRA